MTKETTTFITPIDNSNHSFQDIDLIKPNDMCAKKRFFGLKMITGYRSHMPYS
jgi:hypothetical protein